MTYQFSSVQSLSCVQLFATPWTAALQASLSVTKSWRLPKLKSIESVMLSNDLILCYSFLLLPSIFPSIRVFANELALHIRWPKYWSFSFSLLRVFSNTTVQKHQYQKFWYQSNFNPIKQVKKYFLLPYFLISFFLNIGITRLISAKLE